MLPRYWVGLDVGIHRTNACVITTSGELVAEQSLTMRDHAVPEFLSTYPKANVESIALESGTSAQLVRSLRSLGYEVQIFEAHAASKFLAIQRNKNDRNDARGLAEMARTTPFVPTVYLKSMAFQTLRTRLTIRRRLVQQRMAVEMLVRSIFHLYGRTFKRVRCVANLRPSIAREVDAVRAETGVDLNDDLAPLLLIAEALRSELSRIQRELESFARSDEICRRLMSVPGVGAIGALSYYSAIENPARFARLDSVAAYLGLVPIVRQSGDTVQRKGISKMGCKVTRSSLYIAAGVLVRKNSPDSDLKRWAVAARERLGARKGNVATARKLAVLLLSLWRNGKDFTPFRPPLAGKT